MVNRRSIRVTFQKRHPPQCVYPCEHSVLVLDRGHVVDRAVHELRLGDSVLLGNIPNDAYVVERLEYEDET